MFLFAVTARSEAAEIRTELARSSIPAGESTVLKLMISGSTSDIKPVSVPAVDGLRIVMSGTSRSFQFVNGRTWTGIILNFTVYAGKKGVYKIPPFVVEADGERLQSAGVTLAVTDGGGGAGLRPGEGVSIKGYVTLSSTDVYAGEPLLMRYYIKGASSGDIQVEGIKEQPSSKGFVIKQIQEEKSGAGDLYAASFCLIPAEGGVHNIGGGSVSLIAEVEDGFFSRTVRREMGFPRKKVSVKLLPSAGRPDRFKGDVGEFTIESGSASGSFRKGDEIKIPVKVRGRGNLITLSRPGVEKQDGIRLLVEEKEPLLSAGEKDISGEKEFTVTVIPEREGECSIGRIYLTCFNPYKRVYEKVATPPYSFTVAGTSQKITEPGAAEREDGRGAGFYILLIIAVAVAAGGAVFLFMQSREFRASERKAEAANREAGEERGSPGSSGFLKDLESAYIAGDVKNFLLYAERLTGIIDTGKLADTDVTRLKKIRDDIHLCRYGGGVIDPAKMESIYTWLRGIAG